MSSLSPNDSLVLLSEYSKFIREIDENKKD